VPSGLGPFDTPFSAATNRFRKSLNFVFGGIAICVGGFRN
jgi:hypothetical protein